MGPLSTQMPSAESRGMLVEKSGQLHLPDGLFYCRYRSDPLKCHFFSVKMQDL